MESTITLLATTPPPHSSSLTTKTNIFFSTISKTKPLSHTLSIFPLLPSHTTLTWNSAISASLRHSQPLTALRLFLQFLLSSDTSNPPDSTTLRLALAASSLSHTTHLPPQLHSYLLKLHPSHFAPSQLTVLRTCLLNAYLACWCGPVRLVHQLFDEIPEKDVIAFTSVLKGFVEAGEYEEAIGVFRDLVGSEVFLMGNEHAYSCALNACSGLCCLFGGQQIHAHVLKSMMRSDVYVGTGLVDLYVKCGEMESARKAFTEIHWPNVVSYNALLAGDLEGVEGLRLLSEMRLLGLSPDHVTFASVLRDCKGVVNMNSVKQLHGLVMKMMDVELDVFLSCALFEAYVDSGSYKEAQKVFARMKKMDDAAFNVAIQGYFRNGHHSEALELFIEALKMGKEVREVNATLLLVNCGGIAHGKQLHALVIKFCCYDNTSMAASLIRMYCEHKHLDEAIHLFGQIPSPDLVLWTDLISNFTRCGENQGALNLYVKMTSNGVAEPPNHYTFSTLLKACAQLDAITEGRQIHAQIIKSNLSNNISDPFVASALLFMYSKCGYIQEARMIFDKMPERDLASWNAMITSLAQHGLTKECIQTFEESMNQKDVTPNQITFVGVLTACSHGRMVELGYKYFRFIREPTIDHYACLISLFGRAGKLKEALDIVEKMPFEANEIIWSSLLAASCTYGNVELGEYSAQKMLELNPKDPATYVSLSNIYAAAGKWEDMKRIRKLMKSQADSKYQGISWLRANGEDHAFTANEKSCISD